jgi:L-amino acid N-acyltransferase YncA
MVAETGETGLIAFAASFPYSSRPCYRGIGEFSVYVRRIIAATAPDARCSPR